MDADAIIPKRITDQAEMAAADGADEEDGDGAVPEVGMVFKSHEEVTRFYKRYAARVGFVVSVRRSSFAKEGECLYLELMCSKGGRKRPEPKFRKRSTSTTNCSARIRAKLWGDGFLHLELANLDHNHPVSPSMARFLSSHTRHRHPCPSLPINPSPPQSPYHLNSLESLLFAETSSSEPRGRLPLAHGDADALRLFFTKMQARNPSFFHVTDLDDQGYIRNIFWADARSRAAYRYFSDVVMLDTSYLINNYETPLAMFVGSNHHGQSVLLGCALLSDETAETFVWLVKTWLACMSGLRPKAFISDQCRGIESAVAEVLPGIRYRFCLFQIMRRVPEKLGGLTEYRAINKHLQKAVFDSLRIEEFEAEWRQMIDVYGLQGNEWLHTLYGCRLSWVPAYLKDAFWAGMSTNQQNETLNSFFDGHVEGKTSVKQFVEKYEMVLQSKYEKEAQADFETFHKRRPSVSKFIMEEQLSKVYTLSIFKKFQDEIEAIMYCHPSFVKAEGSISTFDVKECIFLGDGKKTTTKIYAVHFNNEEKAVQCICGSFQFRGILCRHVLSVFKSQQVYEIPNQYILDRWKKDFKQLHVTAFSMKDVIVNNRIDRYDCLTKRCLQLVEVGVISEKYQLALRLIEEMEKFLLSDSNYDDTQPRIISWMPKANKLGQNADQNVGGHMLLPPGKNSVKNNKIQRAQAPTPKVSHESLPMSKPGSEGYSAIQGLPTEGLNRAPGSFQNHAGPFTIPQQYIDNQGAPQHGIVYMLPGGIEPQTLGSGPLMPWIYHQMFQSAPQSLLPAYPSNGQSLNGQKVHCSSKLRRCQSLEVSYAAASAAAPTNFPSAFAHITGPSASVIATTTTTPALRSSLHTAAGDPATRYKFIT